MVTQKTDRQVSRCVYVKVCYLAGELKCFGYKTDCPLFQESTGELYNESRFSHAMDKLINNTIAKYHDDDQT